MPAKSKEQQRLFGMVHAYQKGELKNPSKEVEDIAKTISKKDAKDFAETKHKGLPNKVKKSVKETVTLSESQLRQIIAESVKKVLKEDSAYQMGRGEVGIDAAYQRIYKALDALKRIADTMSDNGYYETEESALRSQINYIEQEINYIRNQ